MCRWRHVRNLYLRCGHACNLPPEEIHCGKVHCKFSPKHPSDCVPPSCNRTCNQYHLFPEQHTPNIDGFCSKCIRGRYGKQVEPISAPLPESLNIAETLQNPRAFGPPEDVNAPFLSLGGSFTCGVQEDVSQENATESSNESQISTFVIYMPDKLRKNDSTAVRPEDVLLLENHIPSGGSATSIHTSIEAETWVEHNYDTALLRTIRSVGLGGPMATMLSTDIPALAIFGFALNNRVLELAKTLSVFSMFPVMVRPVADDPLVKFIEERRNMAPEASSHSTAGDWSDTEEDIISDSESTDTESEDENDYRGESGVLRLRGGSLHRHRNLNLVDDPDYITPAGIARPDGSHRARVRLHLQLRENILYDVSICSKNAFKFQTEKAEHPHELTEPITRPQLLSCIDLKVEARPIEVLLDRSYSNLGFVVRRAESIAGREYLPRGFDPPSAKATHSKQKTKQDTASMAVGLASMQPTFTAAASRSRTAAETLQLADEKPVPACHVTEQIGKEWEEVDKSFSSYDVSWHPITQKSKVPHPVNIRFGMGIEFFGKEERDIKKLPSISHILRNQIILWVFDPELKAKVRGMIVLTTTYIADIKITEPLTITEDRVVDLAVNGSHSPPATDMTPLTPHAANSLAIALFDESKDTVKRNMQALMDKVSALFDRKGRAPELIDLPLHEYVARGWDATNGQWRNTVWPTLDQGFVGCPRSSAAWNLALKTNQNPYDQDGNFDPRTLYGSLEEDGMEVDA